MRRLSLAVAGLALSAMTASTGAIAADYNLRDELIGRSYIVQSADGPVIVYFGRDGNVQSDQGNGNWTVKNNREVCTQFNPEPATCWTVTNYEVFPAYDADGVEMDTSDWLATDDRDLCTTLDAEAQTCFELRSDGTVIEMEANGQSQRGVLFEGNARRLKKGG